MRKSGSVGSKVKAQGAIEAAKGSEPLSQIARRLGVHPIQLGKWRAKLIQNAYQVFENNGVIDAAQHELEVQSLYEQIGRLKVENDFLKKKSGGIS